MSDVDFLGHANGVAALLLAVAGLVALLLKVHRAQKAAVIRAHEAAKVIDRVAAEFVNNHGSSMKDAIDRLEAGQMDQARQLHNLHESQSLLIRRVDDAYRLLAQRDHHDQHPEES